MPLAFNYQVLEMVCLPLSTPRAGGRQTISKTCQ